MKLLKQGKGYDQLEITARQALALKENSLSKALVLLALCLIFPANDTDQIAIEILTKF